LGERERGEGENGQKILSPVFKVPMQCPFVLQPEVMNLIDFYDVASAEL
jgi:hypothetical protein